MRVIPILILSILMSSCVLFKKEEITAYNPNTSVRLDSEAIQPCDLLKEDLIIVTFDEALNEYANLANQYGRCAIKQNNSIKLLKQFSGTAK